MFAPDAVGGAERVFLYTPSMAKLGTNEIREFARKLVRDRPGGIRYGELMEAVLREHPETPRNTIAGAIWDLAKRFPDEVSKPSRGLFVAAGAEATTPEPMMPKAKGPPPKEEEFYGPFADWLKNELDEATVACALGGASLRDKWGTPDVVGVYKPLPWNLVKFNLEIVSAEIKVASGASIEAFGQAVAYRLFSAKSYIVMPSTMSEADLSRIEALAMLFGIGFVQFDPDPSHPNFAIRVRAQRFVPDMFYVNEFADRLRQSNEDVF